MRLEEKIIAHLLEKGYTRHLRIPSLWTAPDGERTMSLEWALKHCLEAETDPFYEIERFLSEY
jgi:hypothetical protein